MSRWQPGEAEIERLLSAGELQRVIGGEANGEPWLERGVQTLASAAPVDYPPSMFTLSYDAARMACTALMAQQGLRPTTKGGHYAVEQVVRAQFGSGFRSFGVLRRRRNEIEYPAGPHEDVTQDEAAQAMAVAQSIIDAVQQLLGRVGLF